MSASDKIKDWIARMNSETKTTLVAQANKFSPLQVKRFSSGILNLDLALGGGWPFSRICLIAGEESTGKTSIALKAMASILEYDSETHLHKSQLPPGKPFECCKVLFVDMEGSLDEDWAIVCGVDLDHVTVARPEHAQECVDLITSAIRENVFDLIVLDSIAAMTPMKELEASSEDSMVGEAARINNRAMRRWVGSLARLSQEEANSNAKGGPTIICLNQFREKIGVMWGDPRTLPGGKGQRFAAAIIVYTNSAEIKDEKSAAASVVTLNGVLKKNKTFRPREHYSFDFGVADSEELAMGTVNNFDQLIAASKRCELLAKGDDGVWRLGSKEYKTQKALVENLAGDPNFQLWLWQQVITKHMGG